MKKHILLIVSVFMTISAFSQPKWDILEKTMENWDLDGGTATNHGWQLFQNAAAQAIATQENGFVNFKKTNVNTSARWAWLRSTPALADLTLGEAYSIEIQARVQPTEFQDEGNYFESNQIALRLGGKNTAAPVYLRYGNEDSNRGFVSTTSGGTVNALFINTNVWRTYRLVLHPDHSKYDVFVDDLTTPALENAATIQTSDQNGIYLGAESYHRCNIDIRYVKMATGAHFGKPKIASLELSARSQNSNISAKITATVHTMRIEDGFRLLLSVIDASDREVTNSQEITVFSNKATIQLPIPAGLTPGRYFIRVSPAENPVDGFHIATQQVEYRIRTSAWEGKNLATFGNSITAAANSWAYLTAHDLGFSNLYNGAVSAAVWYPRTGNSNCAVEHLKSYFKALDGGQTPQPHVIILAYGTNDDLTYRGNAETALSGEDLAKVDVSTLAGALRWCLDTLQRKIPNTALYVALPLQSSSISKNEGNLLKMEVIRRICEARNVPIFDTYHQSGITAENHGIYLSDGLHPNELGKALQASYIMDQLEASALALALPFVVEEKNAKSPVQISKRVLHRGESYTIASATNQSPLAEIHLYSAAGKRIFQKTVSSRRHTLLSPDPGLYFLVITQENKTQSIFKLIVL